MAGTKYKIEIGVAGVEKTVAGINKVRNASQARAAAAEARRRHAQYDLEEKMAAESALPPKQRLANLERERERNKKRLADAERKLQERERRGLKSPAMDHRVQALRLANREIDRHISKIKQANTESRKEGIFGQAGSAIGRKARGMLAGAGAFFGLRAGRQALADVGELVRNAGTIGVGTDFLQEFQFGGRENSISARTTAMGLQRFGRRVQEAQAGTGELRKSLQELNIDPVNKTIQEVMNEFADAIAALPENQRLRHAFKAFDSEGAALVNVIANGSAGLAEMAKRAHEAGGVIENDVVLRLAETDMKLEVFGQRLRVEFAEALDSLLTTIEKTTPFVNAFVDALSTLGVFVSRLVEEIASGNFSGAFDDALAESRAFSADRMRVRKEEAEQDKKLMDSLRRRKAAGLVDAPVGEEPAARVQNSFKKSVDQLQQIGGFRGVQSNESRALDQQTRELRKLNQEVQKLRQEQAQGNRRLGDNIQEALG